jgi:hypothetical protein
MLYEYIYIYTHTYVTISTVPKVTVLFNSIFKSSNVQKDAGINIYNALVLGIILYGNDNCTMEAKDESQES